ncbi:apolipoprotein D-like [Tigriopus californicus]|uniref:apolipoprotein D-like n=1 Tax=Tigriopus californicus TaxID=6832 RepID=UPI0027DA82BC|nr:apolipoprotein D-like [Tigriopus californicus]
MKISLTILIALLGVFTTVSARNYQKSQAGCPPKPETVKVFNQTQYLGDWYQVQGIPTFFSPDGSTCIRARYGQNEDGTISVLNILIYPDGNFGEICGYAYSPDPEHPGDLVVKFPTSPAGNYWLIDTDYENWASVYSCDEILGNKFEYGWVLTRESAPSEAIVQASLDAFVAQGITLDDFVDNPQDGCTYENPSGSSCADE